MKYGVDVCHENLIDTIKPRLSYDETKNYDEWKREVKEKLTELLGDMPEKIDLNIRIEWEEDRESYIEKRIIFTAEKDVYVPCHLWIPKSVKEPVPAYYMFARAFVRNAYINGTINSSRR